MTLDSAVRSVSVEGGLLASEVTAGTTEPVLCIHGISSQRRLWDWLHQAMPELTIVAPDLRGRGGSIGVVGNSDIATHVRDVIAVLDDLELPAVHVCGMSMGGFVAVEMAYLHPERVRSLILVDGGYALNPPPGLDRDSVRQVFADRFGRLGRDWKLEEYITFFVANTAPLLDPADPILAGYLAHDIDGSRVRLSAEALASDAADVFFGPSHWDELNLPVRYLYAEWSTGADSPPGYSPEAVERLSRQTVSATLVGGVDHAASIMSPRGAEATARAISEALAAGPDRVDQ